MYTLFCCCLTIGTDGHLKLGDFGLSKVVGVPKDVQASTAVQTERDDAVGLPMESFHKVRKFLPLKLDGTQKEEEQAESVVHRTIKILLITMDDAKADSTLLFINTTVAVVIADYDIDSDTVRLSAFDAIFIDGDYYQEDSVDLVAHFCSHVLNGLPVMLCAASEDLRQRGLQAGARACSRQPLEALTEEIFDLLFTTESNVSTDVLTPYLSDLILYVEEKAKQQQTQESTHLSQDDRGFNNDGSQTRRGKRGDDTVKSLSHWTQSHRDSVAVESRSHSLVGTLHFIAPEVIRLRKYGKAVDWWACGMTFYECLVRKHLFQGDDKKTVFERIMSAPIVLDELAPFGETVTSLVKGLLNRDIKRRLGTYGAEPIKQHKVFEKIDWTTVSTSNPIHKPAQFVNKKYRADDKDLFYGPRADRDASLRPENLEERNNTSMQRYRLSKKRARATGSSRSSGTSKLNRLSASRRSSGSSNKQEHDILNTKVRSHSKSFSNSSSGSLEYVPEVAVENNPDDDQDSPLKSSSDSNK